LIAISVRSLPKPARFYCGGRKSAVLVDTGAGKDQLEHIDLGGGLGFATTTKHTSIAEYAKALLLALNGRT